ncbi:hypothetical protein SADUNF_Sadunf03G0155800 [Salix dunnii]|uniref:Uncharacterized protein n=1 Tax=Salix dunnii TaxID=1413687 RepID=A0A835N522_9ROSI|nr:hypothetical protein SADUNF_Sadunf03G0155800 [Salix dunnii]
MIPCLNGVSDANTLIWHGSIHKTDRPVSFVQKHALSACLAFSFNPKTSDDTNYITGKLFISQQLRFNSGIYSEMGRNIPFVFFNFVLLGDAITTPPCEIWQREAGNTFPIAEVRYPSRFSGAENRCSASSIVKTTSSSFNSTSLHIQYGMEIRNVMHKDGMVSKVISGRLTERSMGGNQGPESPFHN